ncbi:hypothetical protein HUG10_01930 [Halorarum halophilum]|uniref:Uncharacterized protein n=1 Tax=Halorarum halophilum TaxID=2743090 RepID=A0A7D5KK50_9EURY|nr:hypothetical protein [Halobaculum halophilum]QLG26375.1 hypothetical protein HUG10_01930 [Halobaculum halophilum]
MNAGPLDSPGLGRQLTWRLTAVAEARGLAQYGGAPVRNVLANRHVELSTNAAALREQRTAFGRADADGRAGTVRATARVGTTDLLGPAVERGPAWTDTVLSATSAGDGDRVGELPATSGRSIGSNVTVGVDHAADLAFEQFLRDDLDEASRRSYRAEVTRSVRVVSSSKGRTPPRDPPGPDWTLVNDRRSVSTHVLDRTTRETTNPRTFLDTTLTVQVNHEAVRTWRNGTVIERTRVEWTEESTVRAGLEANRLDPDDGPERPVSPVFVEGGALDGPNLVDVRLIALDRFAGADRVDELARDAARDGGGTTTTVVTAERPGELEPWVYADVAALRERVRNVSVQVPRDDVAAGEANAPAALAATLREWRSSLIDAPETYDGVADRARVAARAKYLDLVIARLDDRAETAADRNDAYHDALTEADVPLTDRLDEVSDAATETLAPDPRPIGDGLAGEVVLTPDAEPGYLTLTAVPSERVRGAGSADSVHPLAARNTNVFTVPGDDVADSVTDTVLPERRTATLRTAGLSLVRANRTLAAEDDRTLRDQRDRLASEVDTSTAVVRGRATFLLADRAGDRLTARDRRAVLDAADARFAGLGVRAVAMTNGSYAGAVAQEGAARADLSPMERDWLGVHLRIALGSAASDERVAVPEGVTVGTVTAERRVTRSLVHDAVSEGTDRAAARLRERYAGGKFGPVVAGLPVAPVPGYWYATVNVWSVEVRGYYPRFAVEARLGAPDGAGTVLRYVRDGREVRFDADGDGVAEHVGRNERVSFQTRTVVLVAVPAGKSGVGDVDGNADERSAGWPCPNHTVPECGDEP